MVQELGETGDELARARFQLNEAVEHLLAHVEARRAQLRVQKIGARLGAHHEGVGMADSRRQHRGQRERNLQSDPAASAHVLSPCRKGGIVLASVSGVNFSMHDR